MLSKGKLFSVFGVFLLFSGLAYAQDTIELGEIVVSTAYRTQVDSADVADNVMVLDSEDIERLPAHNAADALVYVPGIDVITHQGYGRPVSYSMHGSEAKRIRVMVDGITLNTQATSGVPLERLPIYNASQLEVVSGASSAIWGSGLGGIISVTSKDPVVDKKFSGSSKSLVAEDRGKKEQLELSGTIDNLGYYLSGDYMSSGVEDNRDDTSVTKAFNKLNFSLGDYGVLTAVYGLNSGSVNSGIFPDSSWESVSYRHRYGKLGYSIGGDQGRFSIEAKSSKEVNSTEQFTSFEDENPSLSTYKGHHRQISLLGEYYFRTDDVLLAGLDMDWEYLKSPTYSYKALSTQYQAPYVSYLFKEGAWDIFTGLRYDHSEDFKAEWNPTMGVVYSFDDKMETKIRTRLSRSYNLPRLVERRLSATPALGGPWKNLDNNLLKPEVAVVLESGIEIRPIDKLLLDLSVYRSNIKSMIVLNMDTTNFEMQYINKEKYRKEGITLKLDYDIIDQLKFSASASLNRIEDGVTHKRLRNSSVTSGTPRHSFDLGLHYRGKQGFDASLLANYDRWYVRDYDTFQPNDRKFLFDLTTQKRFEKFSLFLNIYNLTNSKYWVDYYKPYSGRYFEGGIKLEW